RDDLRPKLWNVELMNRLKEKTDDPPARAAALLCGYYHALDVGLPDRAGALLDEAMQYRAAFLNYPYPGFDLEAVYFEGFHRSRAESARTHWGRVKDQKSKPQTKLRAEAALMYSEGKYDEAARMARSALEAVAHSKDAGGALAETDWINELLAACESK